MKKSIKKTLEQFAQSRNQMEITAQKFQRAVDYSAELFLRLTVPNKQIRQEYQAYYERRINE